LYSNCASRVRQAQCIYRYDTQEVAS
jgi:hypothetical protein